MKAEGKRSSGGGEAGRRSVHSPSRAVGGRYGAGEGLGGAGERAGGAGERRGGES